MTEYNKKVIRQDVKKYRKLIEISAEEHKATFERIAKILTKLLNEGGTNDKRTFREY